MSIQPADERATLQQAALLICNDIIATPMPSVADIPDRDTLITTPWLHNEMHETIPALPVHAIVTYFGNPTPRSWRVDGRTYGGIGRPGAIGIVPAGWEGQWDIGGSGSVAYIFLAPSRLRMFAAPLVRSRQVDIMPRVAEPDPVGANIVQALIYEAAHPDSSARLFFEQALDLLCMHVLRRHAALDAPPAPSLRQGMANWQVKRVTAYINANLGQPIGLDELAELVSLSRSHFCTSFRQATGYTPHEWVTLRRMEKARDLLRAAKADISEVAWSVGYQTSSAFTAAFRRHAGMTPSQYRRRV